MDIQSLNQTIADNVSIGARVDHGVDGNEIAGRRIGDLDGNDWPNNLVVGVDG